MEIRKIDEVDKSKSSLLKALKVQFVNWCLDSTSHGIPHIAKSNNIAMRIIWTIFVLTSFSYCTFTIVQSFIEYYKYNVVLKISRIDDSPAVFPAITFCNLNPFNEYYATDYIINNTQDGACFLYDDGNSFNQCINSSDSSNMNFVNFIDKLKRHIANDKTLTDFEHYYYGFDLRIDMLVSCMHNQALCYADNFTKYWDNQYGNCYSFNLGNNATPPIMSSVTGETNGLKMELSVMPPDSGTRYAYKTGIRLFVHNQSSVPFTLNSGISLQPGTETYVGIRRQLTNKLGTPYSNCLQDLSSSPNTYAHILFSYFRDLNVTYYDQNFCFKICFQDKLIENCSCCDISTPSIRNATFCETESELKCYNEYKDFFSKTNLNTLCDNACPNQCQTIDYNLALSTAAFPTISYAKNLQTSDNTYYNFPQYTTDTELMDFCRQGFLKFIINYDHLYYTLIDESPALNSNDLLGNLGGQLGLFIGISFLSLVELIELIVELVTIVLNQGRKKMIQLHKIQVIPLPLPDTKINKVVPMGKKIIKKNFKI